MRYISPSMKAKLEKANQSVYDNANPQMDVMLRRARSGLTSTDLFIVQTIREDTDLETLGIALQRINPEKPPHKAWNIYVKNGIAKVATKNLPSRVKEEWVDVLTIGEAVNVDITFDGEWVRDKKGRWNLVTENVPWIFWTNSAGNLYCQHWTNGTPLLLATGVSKISALRAWKNTEVWTEDQGVICVYLKDGMPYYRSFSRQESNGNPIWENERQITTLPTPIQNISLFRTNDYRLGVLCESNNEIHWSITRRNYAGMAIPAERITAKPNMTIGFYRINYKDSFSPDEYISSTPNMNIALLYTLSDNAFGNVHNIANVDDDWGFTIETVIQHGFSVIDPNDFVLMDSINMTYPIYSVAKIGNQKYKIDTANFNNAQGNVKLKFLGTGNSRGEIGQNINPFEVTFTPINLVPTDIAPPEVVSMINIE